MFVDSAPRLFFSRHNRTNPERPMAGTKGVRYLLAAKV